MVGTVIVSAAVHKREFQGRGELPDHHIARISPPQEGSGQRGRCGLDPGRPKMFRPQMLSGPHLRDGKEWRPNASGEGSIPPPGGFRPRRAAKGSRNGLRNVELTER